MEAKLREIERLRADLRLARIRTIEQGKAQLTPAGPTRSAKKDLPALGDFGSALRFDMKSSRR